MTFMEKSRLKSKIRTAYTDLQHLETYVDSLECNFEKASEAVDKIACVLRQLSDDSLEAINDAPATAQWGRQGGCNDRHD